MDNHSMSNRIMNVDPYEIIQAIDEPLLVLSESLTIVFGNRSFYSTFGVNRTEIEGTSVFSIGDGMFDLPIIREKFNQILKERKDPDTFDLDHIIPKAGRRTFMIFLNQILRHENTDSEQILIRFKDITDKLAADCAIMQKRLEIAEESKPIIKIWDDTLILPLIGTLDTIRAKKTTEQLLDAIRKESARFVILDGTAIENIDDAEVANLIKATRAIKLLGAQVILTGIKPEMAMTMVQLGIDLHDIQTRATLKEGMQHALESQGFIITYKGGIRDEQQLSIARDNERLQKSSIRLISPYREP
jgi:PAS domain S-box-containing protein